MIDRTTPTLGTLLDGPMPRDAIHIAVFSAVAGQDLEPGQHVSFLDGNTEMVWGQRSPAVGIVDPFLRARVMKGDRCWVMLYPNSITALRHVWSHPAFQAKAPGVSRDE